MRRQQDHGNTTKKYRKFSHNNSSLNLVSIRTLDSGVNVAPNKNDLYSFLTSKLQRATKTYISFANDEGDVFIQDLRQNNPIHIIEKVGQVKALSFVSDHELAISYDTNQVSIFNMKANSFTKSTALPIGDRLLAEELLVALGDQILLNYAYCDIMVWDTTTNQIKTQAKPSSVYDSRKLDEEHFLNCHDDGTMTIWNINPLKQERFLQGINKVRIFSAEFWCENQFILGFNNTIRILDSQTEQVILEEKLKNVGTITYLKKLDAHRVGIAHETKAGTDHVSIWNVKTRETEDKITIEASHIYRPFEATDKLLVYYEDAENIGIYNWITKTITRKIRVGLHDEEVCLALWSSVE